MQKFCIRIIIFFSLIISLCSCDEIDLNMVDIESDSQSELTFDLASDDLINATTEIKQEEEPQLLQDSKGLYNRMFYIFYPADRAVDHGRNHCISWGFIAGEDKEHNEWIETQTFNSVFRYGDWCIRTGYFNQSGQWGITFFSYHDLESAYVGCGQSVGQTISHENGDYWLVAPNAFGVPDDHSVEITSFDEEKRMVTLTFTSPEGAETEVYFNYVQHCRSDENGTPLLDENGNTFLYQFD